MLDYNSIPLNIYLVSTKIYEYPALGLPVLSINGGGDVEDLIVKKIK